MPLLKLGAKPAQAASPLESAALRANKQVGIAKAEVNTVNASDKAVASTPAAYTGGRPKAADAMSKADWAEKDTRISRQGLYQAALQSVGAMQFGASASLEDYLLLVRKVAEDGLKFVAGGK